MKKLAVLCVAPGSYYLGLDACDCYTRERNAYSFRGELPVIAHPPCAQWGRLRHLANASPEERDLALFTLGKIRTNGGVLEHPAGSKLWEFANLPLPGDLSDAFGGWTLEVEQLWWGHPAIKRTWLYIKGVNPAAVPPVPRFSGKPIAVVTTSRRRRGVRMREMNHAHRHLTPPAFALWLCNLALSCGRTVQEVSA